jgi:hypothetical protein
VSNAFGKSFYQQSSHNTCMLFQTRKAMEKLTEALDTMQDALMAAQTLGQPPATMERDGVALAVSRVDFYVGVPLMGVGVVGA